MSPQPSSKRETICGRWRCTNVSDRPPFLRTWQRRRQVRQRSSAERNRITSERPEHSTHIHETPGQRVSTHRSGRLTHTRFATLQKLFDRLSRLQWHVVPFKGEPEPCPRDEVKHPSRHGQFSSVQ